MVARHDCDVAAPDEGKFRLMLKGREVTRSTLYDVALINVGKKDVRSNHFADEKPLRLVIQGRVLEALPPLHTSLPHSWEVGPMETILSIDPCHIRVKSLHIFSFISEGAVRWYAEDEVPLVDIKFENGSVPALKHPPEVVRFANSLFKSLTEPPRAVRALSSTSGNWLNVVERWFAELTRRVL